MIELPREYRNVVLKEDVIKTLKKLPDQCLDMIYADPDYNVGINYNGKSYTKPWDTYIKWYTTLITESMRVLKDTGNLFTINYPRQNAYLRVNLEKKKMIYDIQEYVWIYNTNIGHSKRRFTTAHRTILHATKSKHNTFYKEQVVLPYQNPTDKRIKTRLASGSRGRMPYSWFYFNLVKNVSKDKTIHACQIPLGLAEVFIKASTKKEDAIFILFGGSGSEVMLTQKMGRVFLSCETHPKYHQMIQERLRNKEAIFKTYKESQSFAEALL